MARGLTWGLLAAGFVLAWLFFDRLGFPVERDELRFWPTSLRFSQSWIPPLELLRDYGELNTPLPFLLWGWLERAFHGGIEVGRYLNLFVSFVTACIVAGVRRDAGWASTFAAAGLLAFPYYLGTATHLYTDVLATFFGVLGVHLHLNRRYAWALLVFALGIATRQYVVAFPAALFLYELSSKEKIRWMMPALACTTLLGWIAFFGGFGPPGEVAKQAVATASPLTLHIESALFFLSVIGLYFVIPERLLFSLPAARRGWWHLGSAIVVVAGFALFPPLGNQVITETMGYTDKAVRLVLPDFARMLLYCALALLAAWRFLREPLPLLFLAMHVLMMLKAHVAWEKYALPLLAVLWYLRAHGYLSGSPRRILTGTSSG